MSKNSIFRTYEIELLTYCLANFEKTICVLFLTTFESLTHTIRLNAFSNWNGDGQARFTVVSKLESLNYCINTHTRRGALSTGRWPTGHWWPLVSQSEARKSIDHSKRGLQSLMSCVCLIKSDTLNETDKLISWLILFVALNFVWMVVVCVLCDARHEILDNGLSLNVCEHTMINVFYSASPP